MFALLLACRDREAPAPTPPPPADTASPTEDPTGPAPRYVPLPAELRAARASMALRGIRPTPDELRTVRDDPAALDVLVDAWLADPAFTETVKELYADALWLRSPDIGLPQIGPHVRTPQRVLAAAVSEEPLGLVGRVVDEDLPLAALVTADWTVLDAVGASLWRGHDYDDSGPDVQVVRFTDGRPAAGLLATNGLWTRHLSMGANANRGRANAVTSAFLCVDHASRDVPIDGSVDLTDDDAVADAVAENPACVSCHQSLDPVGSALWPMFPQVDDGAVLLSYLGGCAGLLDELCYPIRMWHPELRATWRLLRLRPPGLAGHPVDGLGGLGEAIGADPRFASCAARRFWSHLAQVPLDEVPLDVAAQLQSSGPLRARDLARAVVTHPAFQAMDAGDATLAATLPGPLLARPEQLDRGVEALTGFRWIQEVDGVECTVLGVNCYGDTRLPVDDTHGFRAMAGGIDGRSVLVPVHDPTPVQQLFVAALAEEAAGYLFRDELRLPPGERRLLQLVEADTTDEDRVRAQLVELHAAITSELLAPDDPVVDRTFGLWSSVAARGGTARAWKATVAALLQSPRAQVY